MKKYRFRRTNRLVPRHTNEGEGPQTQTQIICMGFLNRILSLQGHGSLIARGSAASSSLLERLRSECSASVSSSSQARNDVQLAFVTSMANVGLPAVNLTSLRDNADATKKVGW